MKILMATCGGFVRQMESWSERLLAKELVKFGYEVSAITTTSVMKIFPDAKKHEFIDNIEVFRYNPYYPRAMFHAIKNDYDMIHTHFPGYMSGNSSWVTLSKKFKDVKIVHTVHGLYHDPFIIKNVDDPFSNPINYGGMQKSLRPWKSGNWFCHVPIFGADMVLPQSRFESEELKKFGVPEEKMRIVPTSGIDLEKYKNLPKKGSFQKKYSIEKDYVLFVGQPIKRKGPEYLAQAMKIIQKKYDMTLVFVGYKRDRELEDLCKDIDVMFTGFLSEADKIAAYCDASVFCLPTLYEGFGLIFLEAMASGCPIITTNTPGISELIQHRKHALLVRPKNSADLAEAIKSILNNTSLRSKLVLNASRRVKDYSWPKVAKEIETIYENVK